MIKLIQNYKKLFLKILKNDLEGFEGGKFDGKNNNNDFKEKAEKIIDGVKGKLEKLKISVGNFLFGDAVEKEKIILLLNKKNQLLV